MHFALVRAWRSPDNNNDVLWDCRKTEEPTGGWLFEGKVLSLELDDNRCSRPRSTAYVWDVEMGYQPRCEFQIRLDGEIKHVSSPGVRC